MTLNHTLVSSLDKLQQKYMDVLKTAALGTGQVPKPPEEKLMRVAYYRGVKDGMDLAREIAKKDSTTDDS